MGWGFRKVIRLGRGLRLTLGKKSAGISAGIGPFRVGYNSRSGPRERVTLRGTGLYYERRQRKTASGSDSDAPRARSPRFARVAIMALGVLLAVFVPLRHVR